MILFGTDFWNPAMCKDSQLVPLPPTDRRKPAWPLLTTLAVEAGTNRFDQVLKLTDDPDAVIDFMTQCSAMTPPLLRTPSGLIEPSDSRAALRLPCSFGLGYRRSTSSSPPRQPWPRPRSF
jgi:hypothetical protein